MGSRQLLTELRRRMYNKEKLSMKCIEESPKLLGHIV